MKYYIVFIILIINRIYSEHQPRSVEIANYGFYCGLQHTSEVGDIPIDELDSFCQIHDICTSYGLLQCFCNEQLYLKVSNFNTITENQQIEKDNILSALYISVLNCGNFNYLDQTYLVSNMYAGFQYLPIYSYENNPKVLEITNVNDIQVITMNMNNYQLFVKLAHTNLYIYDSLQHISYETIKLRQIFVIKENYVAVAISTIKTTPSQISINVWNKDASQYYYDNIINTNANNYICINDVWIAISILIIIILICIIIALIIFLIGRNCNKNTKNMDADIHLNSMGDL